MKLKSFFLTVVILSFFLCLFSVMAYAFSCPKLSAYDDYQELQKLESMERRSASEAQAGVDYYTRQFNGYYNSQALATSAYIAKVTASGPASLSESDPAVLSFSVRKSTLFYVLSFIIGVLAVILFQLILHWVRKLKTK